MSDFQVLDADPHNLDGNNDGVGCEGNGGGGGGGGAGSGGGGAAGDDEGATDDGDLADTGSTSTALVGSATLMLAAGGFALMVSRRCTA